MAKIIKKVLYFLVIPLVLILSFTLLVIRLINPNWTYKLENDYYVRKTSNQNVEVSKKIKNKYYTYYHDKKIGISSYVAEFQYNSKFVGVKVLEVEDEDTMVNYYLIDMINNIVKGPYSDEETYLSVVGVWSSEVLGDWITTTTNPNK